MARPKLGDSDTERVHLKITADEIQAIDAWRFRKHVPTRSEAIRQLCELGISSNEYFEDVARRAHGVYVASTQLLDNLVERNRPGTTETSLAGFISKYMETVKEVIDLSREIGQLAAHTSRAADASRAGEQQQSVPLTELSDQPTGPQPELTGGDT